MFVKSILKEKGNRVVATGPDVGVDEVARLLHDNKIGAVIVLDEGGNVAGILSERDLARGVALNGAKVHDLKVSDLMTKDVITVAPDDTTQNLMEMMTGQRIRHLPVVNDGKVVGLISIGDVVKHRLAEIKLEADSLKEYVAGNA